MEGRIQGALSCLGNWVSQALSDEGGGVSPGVADLRVGQLTSLLWLILVFDRVLNVSCVSRSCTELWGPQLSSVWQLAV